MRQILATIPLFFVFALVVFYNGATHSSLGLPFVVVVSVAGMLLFGALVFAMVNWRCPACNASLGKKISPRFCSRCGAQLQE